jgi:hypothetical protein
MYPHAPHSPLSFGPDIRPVVVAIQEHARRNKINEAMFITQLALLCCVMTVAMGNGLLLPQSHAELEIGCIVADLGDSQRKHLDGMRDRGIG